MLPLSRKVNGPEHPDTPAAMGILAISYSEAGASSPPMSDVTRLLEAIQHGDARAGEELLPLVYAELRALARAKMAREQPGHTLQPTALVHEA